MSNFEFPHGRDEAGESIAREIEERCSSLPVQATAFSGGSFIALMSVDAGSGKFISFNDDDRKRIPGGAIIRIIWETNPVSVLDLAKDFMGNLKNISIQEVAGASLSQLAKDRIAAAIINIQERIREN